MIGVLLRQENAAAAAAITAVGWERVDDPFARDIVLLWSPRANIHLPAWEPVLKWMDQWEVAVPFRPYITQASLVGSEEERAATAKKIFDMRQPVYDSRVVVIRTCPSTRKLLRAWTQEMQDDGDDDLAFLRAVWQVKPLLLAMPTGWVKS